YIGCPFTIDEIKKHTKYRENTFCRPLSENIWYLGEIERVTDFENKKPVGYELINGEKRPDFLLDDTALAYKGKEGIFVITGCSHSGICNIIEQAKRVCDDDRVVGVIGGFHLFDDDEQLRKTIEYFEKNNIKLNYPCHCVSLVAKAKMMEKFNVIEVGVGLEIEIE
ncbi:MAG: MBL fold metallo-hydrolase, partial [Clostridia bacterium]|nr:MBL fold metallo-hydrolase [Clostridia bacterium]